MRKGRERIPSLARRNKLLSEPRYGTQMEMTGNNNQTLILLPPMYCSPSKPEDRHFYPALKHRIRST